MHRDLLDEGEDRRLRDRDEPMHCFALGSALSLALDPVLTEGARIRDADPVFQAVQADWLRRVPRTPMDGCPSTAVEGILRMLVVKHLDSWRDEATDRTTT
jgi:IS5 family transposase